jgi:hypothetical protein
MIAALNAQPMQQRFLQALPRIQLHAKISSRHIKCSHKRQDFISEVVGLCWKWWQRLVERGKKPWSFVSTLASFATKAVRSGRRVCGQLKPRDVHSERAQQRHSFCLTKLPDMATLSDNPLSQALIDNTQTPPDEQAMFRLDFASWLRSLSRRDKALATDMGMGEGTMNLAQRYGLSPSRISQKRGLFQQDWQRFNDPVETT